MRWVFVSLMLLAATTTLWAQNPEGEIRIEVKDPSGAAMRVSGRLQNPAARIDRSFLTDTHGLSTLARLPYGRYRVEVSKSGFATQSIFLDVQSSAPVTSAITMTLAAQSSAIEVVAATAPFATEAPVR